MLIAALYTIAKVWKQPVLDEWINMMWETYVMEQYSATKKKLLPFQTTWIDLENIMLSEISYREKDKPPYEFVYKWSLKKQNEQ